jgi:hypothetical protein
MNPQTRRRRPTGASLVIPTVTVKSACACEFALFAAIRTVSEIHFIAARPARVAAIEQHISTDTNRRPGDCDLHWNIR